MDIKIDFFSYDALKVLQNAHKVAQSYNFPDVGTDHLLYSFCQQNDFFEELGLNAVSIKLEVFTIFGEGNSTEPPSTYTPKLKSIIENAFDEVESFRDGSVEPIHIFISLLKEKNAMSYVALENLKIDVDDLIERARSLIKKELVS